MIELVVAMAIIAFILLPTAYSISAERRLMRAMYQRAIAMEIVDGEMETLAAGGWRGLGKGVVDYPVKSNAATNLPPGRFILTLTPEKLRLEWQPSVKQHGGPVVREVRLK
jgi:hypothetical protein